MALCLHLEILHCVQDDGIRGIGNVIPNAMRDLLNVTLCQHLEILHYVQDDVITYLLTTKHRTMH
ncbi:hypothetical protein [Legionella quateirensis]|uniref:hypothetical protein n=1 Tax=Legionella quateirensis TaxID=45072 RepID=UPI0011C01824|nr:hypothetical protein [Legionella quateirensis]